MHEIQIRKFQDNNKYKVNCGKQVYKSHNIRKPCNFFLIKDNLMIKVYYKMSLIKKKKLLFNTCLKHTYVYFVSDESISISANKSLLLGDPLKNDFIVDIGNPNLMFSCYTNLSKEREHFNKEMSIIKFQVLIKNTTATFDKMSARMIVNGSTTGKDLRNYISVNLSLNNCTKYLLLLNTEKAFLLLRDDVSILMLHEHFMNNNQNFICSEACYKESKEPDKELEIYIKADKRKEFKINEYSLKEKWIEDEIPCWLMNLLADLYFDGPETRGIFRESASIHSVRNWINQINTNDYFTIADKPLVKASILKVFIRGIKQGLFSKGYIGKHLDIFYFQGLTIEEFLSDENKKNDLINDLKNLPKKNFLFLQNLLVVLSAIINNQTDNNTIYNISVLFNQSFFDNESELFRQEATLKLTEVIIKLTDYLVDSSDKKEIIKNFRFQRISRPDIKSSNSLLCEENENSSIYPLKSSISYQTYEIDENNESCENVNNENNNMKYSLKDEIKNKNMITRRASISVCDSISKYSNRSSRRTFSSFYDSFSHRSRSPVQNLIKIVQNKSE